MHFFGTLKSWMCKINVFEVFLGHSSQKYFLNLLLQKKKTKTRTENKQTKPKQNQKNPRSFSCKYFEGKIEIQVAEYLQATETVISPENRDQDHPLEAPVSTEQWGGQG